MEKDTIIKIENLVKTYHFNGTDIPILDGINLSIKSTDFCILYGPSGSGKSTLLHQITGLESPTKGKVSVRGTNISALSEEKKAIFRSQKFGIVYQMWYWIKPLTVWENVAMPLLIMGIPKSEARKRALESLAEVGMQDYALKYPVQLSGGEQQKALLARALVNNPWIIIADEPTGNLDTHSADQIMHTLQDLNVSHKRTIIMVTHNLIYLPMATRRVALKDGQIVTSDQQIGREIKTELKGVI